MVSQNKRREKDVMKLLVSQFEVHLPNDSNTSEFIVKFVGPVDSPYEGVSSHLKFNYTSKLNECGFVQLKSLSNVKAELPLHFTLKLETNLF